MVISWEPVVENRMEILAPGVVRLNGFLDRYLRLSIEQWCKSAIPYQALANFFRLGRPVVQTGGRSTELFASGEMWGKAVRSAALFYRYTGDPELKTILQATVRDLLGATRGNGALSCSPVEAQPDGRGGDLWERKYVLLALDEYYRCVDQDPDVLAVMIAQADVTLDQVGLPPKKRIVELGWSYDLVGGNNIESSTILEPIMRLYFLTGYSRYLEFARYIVEIEGGARHHRIIDEVLTGMDLVDVGGVYPKAYEMLSLFEGLVEYYRATGNERWHDAIIQLFNKAIEREITIVGNGGGDQPYHPNVRGEAWNNTAFEQTNPDVERMMETCTGVTWLKFCHQILRLTGNPVAADYIELYAYNGLIGAMKPEGDGFSYVNLLNGVKTNKEGWGTTVDGVYVTCCNLNGPEGLAYLPWIAVMIDAEGPVVNLYEAGEMQFAAPGGETVSLRIVSSYPLNGAVRIEIDTPVPATFALKLRIPSWSAATELSVNGTGVAAPAGHYAALARTWQQGDTIELQLDMRCRIINARSGLSPGSDRYQALQVGPIVLARDENLDPCFGEAVDICASDGFVQAEQVAPTSPDASLQFLVPTSSGRIPMVDYASVNSWSGGRVQTWLPMSSGVRLA